MELIKAVEALVQLKRAGADSVRRTDTAILATRGLRFASVTVKAGMVNPGELRKALDRVGGAKTPVSVNVLAARPKENEP